MLPHGGWPDVIAVLLFAMAVFGPQRMAGLGTALGQAITVFRKALRAGDDDRPSGGSTTRHGQ